MNNTCMVMPLYSTAHLLCSRVLSWLQLGHDECQRIPNTTNTEQTFIIHVFFNEKLLSRSLSS